MASTFKAALASRHEALALGRAQSGTWSVKDLALAYGSKRELADAYAAQMGVKRASAQKALSRLERYERGERGGDVRAGSKKVKEVLNHLGRNLPEAQQAKVPPNATGVTSGEGGGTVSISGTIGVAGFGGEYDEDRDISYDFDEEFLDELADIAYNQGESAAESYFAEGYGFSSMVIVNADITVD